MDAPFLEGEEERRVGEEVGVLGRCEEEKEGGGWVELDADLSLIFVGGIDAKGEEPISELLQEPLYSNTFIRCMLVDQNEGSSSSSFSFSVRRTLPLLPRRVVVVGKNTRDELPIDLSDDASCFEGGFGELGGGGGVERGEGIVGEVGDG